MFHANGRREKHSPLNVPHLSEEVNLRVALPCSKLRSTPGLRGNSRPILPPVSDAHLLFSKTTPVSNSFISSSTALQDHYSKSCRLDRQPPLRLPTLEASKPPLNQLQRRVNQWKREAQRSETSGIKRGPKTVVERFLSGWNVEEIERVLGPPQKPLTLAQKAGLVPLPRPKLSEAEWKSVKARCMDRFSSPSKTSSSTLPNCAICTDAFELTAQVLLSCSHTFHRSCNSSYEKFTGRKICPLCRTADYETRLIFDGALEYRKRCVVLIQSVWRGYRERRKYSDYRKTQIPRHPLLRKKYYEQQLSSYTNSLAEDVCNIDDFFAELDYSVAQSCTVIDQTTDAIQRAAEREDDLDEQEICNGGIQIPHVQWDLICQQAIEREFQECPICLEKLSKTKSSMRLRNAPPDSSAKKTSRVAEAAKTGSKPITVTSCAHVFHATCLAAFEIFNNPQLSEDVVHICPVCRKDRYEKLQLLHG